MNFPSEQEIMAVLATIPDPELGQDLVSLKMIPFIRQEIPNIVVGVELTTPSCPLKTDIADRIKQELKKLAGVEEVKLEWSAKQRPSNYQVHLPQIKRIIAVSSGKGGVGKTTVAAYLAKALVKAGKSV